jgi:hypothetical protein
MRDARTEYHQRLASLLWKVGDIRAIARTAGLDMGEINWEAPARTVWRDVLDLAIDSGRFPALHERIMQEITASEAQKELRHLRSRMAPGLANGGRPGGEWYSAPEPQQARLVGQHAMHAVFDRVDLRSHLHLMAYGLTALFVDGPARTGRSYTWHLVQHVAAALEHRAVLIDIKSRWGPPPAPPCTARELLSALVARLDMRLELPAASAVQPDTEPRLLVDKLIGAWPPPRIPPGGRFWIMIDGIDHTNVTRWTVELVERLVQAADNSEFPAPQPQFVLTGYRGGLAQLLAWAEEERIQAIDRQEVEQFFRDTACHLDQPADEAFLASLVDQVYEGLPVPADLEMLNRRAAALARRVLAGIG